MSATEKATFTNGDIVTILGDNRFTDMQGVIVDTCSNLNPDDGPIAVYFDNEVWDSEFNIFSGDKKWTGGVPNSETYRNCYRVICFKPEELRKEAGFPIEVIVKRKFGDNWHEVNSWKFPLRPGTHACQFASCKTALPATELTLVNVWGSIVTVYSCKTCHKEWHGMRTDGITLKDPLPGADAERSTSSLSDQC